ncbi:MAG: hypothetical protein A2096_09530 [Spirochaetes bacterium GWF1_41_5]|nr:MAG: hypothetical protein A2096_09530 [Spirochaetes bacterium GWF1_41_5]HBE02194.1 rubrerythrin [Spirochaetia bacterium]
MTGSLQQIIDFAVEQEIKAAAFYREIAGRTDFKSVSRVIEEFAAMEDTHVLKLRMLDKTEFIETAAADDLQLSDYLAEPAGENPGYQEILVLAIKKEQRSALLYHDLAQKAGDTETGKLFRSLSFEEMKHKQFFEKKYDSEILTEN